MILKEQLGCEIKIAKIVKTDEGFIIEDYDKDDNLLDKYPIDDILDKFNNKSYVKIKIEYTKELE